MFFVSPSSLRIASSSGWGVALLDTAKHQLHDSLCRAGRRQLVVLLHRESVVELSDCPGLELGRDFLEIFPL